MKLTSPLFLKGRYLTASLALCGGGAAATLSTSAEAAPARSTFKVALCQMLVVDDKATNLRTAERVVREAAANGAQVISLPEIFNGPYDTSSFPLYAEEVPADMSKVDPAASPSVAMLRDVAKDCGVYLIGGSISERDGDKVFNCSLVFDPSGKCVAKHRKMHLFDIDIPGKITFKESDTLTAGDSVTSFKTPWCTIGVGICYDIRFEEYAMLLKAQGCEVLVYPGCFNMTTGPRHWELLQRARANDNQCYVMGVSTARNPESVYQAWGHSTIVGPWAAVEATTDENPGIVYGTVDLNVVKEVRSGIPIGGQKRTDVYQMQSKI